MRYWKSRIERDRNKRAGCIGGNEEDAMNKNYKVTSPGKYSKKITDTVENSTHRQACEV